MQKISTLIIIFAFLWGSNSQSNLYNLVLHPQDRGGACLDGSPPGLYIHEGTGANKNKFMMYFDSGGFCGAGSLADTLQSCYRRSSTSLGTTKNYKPQKSFNNMGLLSPLKEQNPVFYDWTKVFVIYCDGSEYAGYRQNPIQYKDKNLYFRGSRNVMAQFRYMDEKHDFYNGDIIVMTGVSAGGIATYQWTNYLMEHTKKAKVYGIPDSGFFITDYFSQVAQQKVLRDRAYNLLNLINSQLEMPQPIQKCLKKPGFDVVDCFNAGNYAQFLKAPLFIVESPYDSYSLQNIVVIRCMKNSDQPFSLENCDDKNMKYIQNYRNATLKYLTSMKGNRNDVGLWAPSCAQHGFSDEASFTDEHFKVKGLTVAQAIQKFLDNPQNAPWLADQKPWPSNEGCNGMAKLGKRKIRSQ